MCEGVIKCECAIENGFEFGIGRQVVGADTHERDRSNAGASVATGR